MKTTIIILLGLLLLLSNVFWIYQTLDSAVTASYRDQLLHEEQQTRQQLMASLPEIASKASRAEVIAAAARHTDMPLYEKEGCIWVGWLGLSFDAQDRLQAVVPTWSSGPEDDCPAAQ